MSDKTIRRWRREGRLPTGPDGQITMLDLLYRAGQRAGATPPARASGRKAPAHAAGRATPAGTGVQPDAG